MDVGCDGIALCLLVNVLFIVVVLYVFFFFFFFFSSRRRHTRLTCDWSSDVCSSDLPRSARLRRGGRDRGSRRSTRARSRADLCRAACLSRRRARRSPSCSRARSEEHTSELQSHVNLVCRLLLEKKKYKKCDVSSQ